MGAHHTSELQYLFNLTAAPGMAQNTLNTAQKALGATMVKYWANFVKNGNPNGTGVPSWVQFTSLVDTYQGLDLTSGGGVGALAINFATSHNCTAWNGFTAYTPTKP